MVHLTDRTHRKTVEQREMKRDRVSARATEENRNDIDDGGRAGFTLAEDDVEPRTADFAEWRRRDVDRSCLVPGPAENLPNSALKCSPGEFNRSTQHER